jgi:hypothetical protein
MEPNYRREYVINTQLTISIPLQFSHNLNHAIVYAQIVFGPVLPQIPPLSVDDMRALHVILFLQ